MDGFFFDTTLGLEGAPGTSPVCRNALHGRRKAAARA